MPEDHTTVRETRFGEWFQNTKVWRDYVLAEAVAELTALLPPQRRRFDSVLEVGCGSGLAFDLLGEALEIGRIVGIDQDAGSIESARARGACTPIEVRVGDLHDLELPSASMDLVFCHQTLHHVRAQQRGLREMWRVLRPGGILLLAESCRRFVYSLAVRALFRHPMDAQHSPAEYVDLVRKAGFQVEDEDVLTPEPFWSQPDFGFREWLGRPTPQPSEASQLRLVASKVPDPG